MSIVINKKIAQWRYAETGKSAQFVAWFDCLQTSTTNNGQTYETREGAAAIRDLNKILTFRPKDYSTVIYQLCHWIKGLEALAAPRHNWHYCLFALKKPASGSSFFEHLSDTEAESGGRTDAPAHLGHKDLIINYPDFDHDGVRIAYGRMPLLLALIDLLLPTEIYQELDKEVGILLAKPWRHDAVQSSVNAFVRVLNSKLDHHLRKRQAIDKFNQLVQFLEHCSDDDMLHFTDANLLNYWLAGVQSGKETARARNDAEHDDQHGDEIKDVRLYRTAFRDFISVCHAIRDGETAANAGFEVRLGQDIEAGELDLTADYVAAPQGAYQSPLEAFYHEPAKSTNLVNSADRGRLRYVMECGPLALPFWRSLMRAQVFGYVQSEINQALKPLNKPLLRSHLSFSNINNPVTGKRVKDARNYAQMVRQYNELRARIELRVRAIAVLMSDHHTMDFSNRDEIENDDDLNELYDKLDKAKKSVKVVMESSTFDGADGDHDMSGRLEDALPDLLAIRSVLDRFIAMTRSMDEQELKSATDQDLSVFQPAFQTVYGDRL